MSVKGLCKRIVCPCITAARFGCLKLLKWARKRNKRWDFADTPDYMIDRVTASFTTCAAIYNNWRILKWAVKNGCKLNTNTIQIAGLNGNVDFLQFLLKTGVDIIPDNLVKDAIEKRNVKVLDFLHQNSLFKMNQRFWYILLQTPSVEVLNWVLSKGFRMNHNAMRCAVCLGDMNMVRLILKSLGKSYKVRAGLAILAASRGNYDVVKFLKKSGCKLNADIFAIVAQRCDFEMMKWLHQQKCPFNKQVFPNVASNGRLDVMCWLLNKGCFWNFRVYLKAITTNRLDVVQFAFENKCPSSEYLCLTAARGGCVDILKYMLSKGFPYNNRIFINIMMLDDYDLFQWCLSRGCVLTGGMIETILRRGNLLILKSIPDLIFKHRHSFQIILPSVIKLQTIEYLLQNGLIEWTDERTNLAVWYERLDILHFLHNNGLIHSKACYEAANKGKLKILQWLHEEKNYPLVTDVSEETIKYGHLQIVRYLVEKGCLWNKFTIAFAQKHYQFEIYKYLKYKKMEKKNTKF